MKRVASPSLPDAAASAPKGNEMLRITDLHAFYGESHVLHGIDLRVAEGELVTLLGRNGSGRSTTLKSMMGLVGRRSGSIMFNGRELIGMRRIGSRAGCGLLPRGARHLLGPEHGREPDAATGGALSGGMTLDEIYDRLPQPAGAPQPARAPACRAASSRCWPWRASCAPALACCCWTRSPKAWRP
jgi:hypothetical protein